MDFREITEFMKDSLGIIITVLVVFFLFIFVIGLQQVVGPSMEPNYHEGDVVVLNYGRFPGDTVGHIAFADEDYDGSGQMWLLGQNQNNPSATVGSPVARTRMSVTAFLGAFRNKEWQVTPPTPTTKKKHKFPFFIYTHRRKQML